MMKNVAFFAGSFRRNGIFGGWMICGPLSRFCLKAITHILPAIRLWLFLFPKRKKAANSSN